MCWPCIEAALTALALVTYHHFKVHLQLSCEGLPVTTSNSTSNSVVKEMCFMQLHPIILSNGRDPELRGTLYLGPFQTRSTWD
jgi:hypothetical protein